MAEKIECRSQKQKKKNKEKKTYTDFVPFCESNWKFSTILLIVIAVRGSMVHIHFDLDSLKRKWKFVNLRILKRSEEKRKMAIDNAIHINLFACPTKPSSY